MGRRPARGRARVLQPARRRAPWRGADGRPPPRCRRWWTTWPSVQPFWAAAAARRPRPLHAPRGQAIIDHLDELAELLTREQGKPMNESYSMELLPTIDSLRWLAEAGPGILDDERIPLPDLHQAEARPLHLRAARRGGRDRALELPLVDPLRRGGDRADGGQRRGAQARLAHAADRRADPGGVRARRAARGPRAHGPRRRRGRAGARRVERGQDLLHRLGRGRPRRRRGVRAAHEGLGARARRQGRDDRAAPTRTSRTRSRAASGAASPTRGRPARGSSACTWSRRWPSASSRAWWRARGSCGRRPARLGHRDRARWSRPSSSTRSRELVDDAVAAGATCTAAAAEAPLLRARPCSPA